MINFEADKWYRLRVSVAEPTATPDNLKFGSGCTVHKVASDGVWHSAPFSTYSGASSQSGTSFKLTGASRGDFAIKCSAGSHGIKWGQSVAATINSGSHGTGTGMDGNDLGYPPSRPDSLTIDTSAAADGTDTVALSGV